MIVSPETLRRTAEAFYDVHPEALLAGSLGRSAIYNRLFDDPMLEFRVNGEDPLWRDSDTPRDLDFIIPGEPQPLPELPHEADTECFRRPEVFLAIQDGDWWVRSERFGYESRVAAEIMEPTKATALYEIGCLVPPLKTLHWLTGMPFRDDEKYIRTRRFMRERLDMDKDGIPNELYAPFEDIVKLATAVEYRKIARFYQSTVPYSARLALRPYVTGIKRKLMLGANKRIR